MPQNFFITGLPKAGKTTLLRSIIKELKARGLYVGGFLSPEETRSGRRTGFLVQDIESGKTDTLASLDKDGPKVSKYHVDIGSFETIAMLSLSDFQRYDVIIIDEIGPMETKSSVFLDALDEIFSSSTPLIASLHEDMVGNFASQGEVFEIDEGNRQQVYNDIINEIRSISKKAKAGKKAQASSEEGAETAKAVKKPKKEKGGKKIGKKAKISKKASPKKAPKKIARKKAAKATRTKRMVEKQADAHHQKKGVVHKIKDLLGF
jgi:nucleoside-triphosphatase